MIAYEEADRPENIEDILNDSWFDEVNENQLEDDVKNEFNNKENKVKEQLEINPSFFEKDDYKSSTSNKDVSEEKEYTYFKPYFKLEKKEIEINGDFYLKLLGILIIVIL